jgi:hypothetical protein
MKGHQLRVVLRNGSKIGSLLPPRKAPEKHMQHLTVTISPVNREWLRQNWEKLGYRSESHAVDDALRQLRESGKGRSNGNGGVGVD